MINLVYCKQCKEVLSQYGDILRAVYEEICEEYIIDFEPVELSLDIHSKHHCLVSIVRILEQKRFVLTTEASIDTIYVIPLGVTCAESGYFRSCLVCFYGGEHCSFFDSNTSL